MKKIINLLTMFMAFTFSQYSIAGQPGGLLIFDSKAVEEVYGGLKWSLGSGNKKPEVIIGYKKTNVDIYSGVDPFENIFFANQISLKGVDGTDVSLSIDLEKLKVSSIRAKYFEGDASNQNEVSAGFDFNRGPFLGASISAPYRTIGVDYFIESPESTKAFLPYVILNNIEKVSLQFGENWNASCVDNFDSFDVELIEDAGFPAGVGDFYVCNTP